MYKKFCDRCGKLIPADDDALTKYSIRSKEDGGHIDLCSKCETEFEIWLNPTLEPWGMFGKGEKVMEGREELYLKHIDENTGRIAKVLEKVLAKIEHYESKDEHDDTVVTLQDFALYYEKRAVTEAERIKAKDLRRAVDNYIDLMELFEEEESDDQNRT